MNGEGMLRVFLYIIVTMVAAPVAFTIFAALSDRVILAGTVALGLLFVVRQLARAR